MADVRALLRAKRQEALVSHPFAVYSTSGQLRCTVCQIAIKHASAWEGHLGSKGHRTCVARLKEEERVREKSLRKAEQLKREREEEDEGESGSSDSGNKRRRVENTSIDDRSNAPPTLPSGPSEDRKTNVSRAPLIPKTAIDLDWEIFQRTVLEAPEHKETYERATVFAEPELVPETPAGFPSQIADAGQQDDPPKMLEESRRMKEIEERELIMDRLMEEEQAQEEADTKVMLMKNRLEALRKKREAVKASKASSKVASR